MEKTIQIIEEAKIIVIVRGVAREKLIPLVQAMYDGGIRAVECTFNAGGNPSDEEIAENIRMLVEKFGDRMVIGAGTVLTPKQVRLTREAGGCFVISPDTNEEVIRYTKELGLVSIPGAFTPSEVTAAHRAGADFIKLFPVDLFGPRYIKIVSTPISNVRILAVNGITDENMNSYLDAGAVGVGVASGIVNKDLIANGDFEGITRLAKKYTEKL